MKARQIQTHILSLLFSLNILAVYKTNSLLLTRHSSASQSSTFYADGISWSASRLLDGCHGATCLAKTLAEERNWMRLDLQNVFKIDLIVISAVANETCNFCDVNGLNDYHLVMSETETSPRCIRTRTAIDRKEKIITIQQTDDGDPLPESRYITITKYNESLMIAEISVYGECSDGYCGQGCTDFCFCRNRLTPDEKRQNKYVCNGGCQDGWTGEKCNTRLCEKDYFGLNCKHYCHCIHQCDPWTGKCIGPDRRCYSGWHGPSCQKINISSPLTTQEAAIIDANFSTCAPLGNLNAYKISFLQKTDITLVSVIVKQETSTITNPLRSITIDVHPNPIQTVCTEQPHARTGCDNIEVNFFCVKEDIQWLMINSYGNSICEVDFFVCSVGFCGVDCFNPCQCENHKCNSDCSCAVECKQGWYGEFCDSKCPNKTYGPDCSHKCHCQRGGSCDYITGICSNGCSEGWSGEACDQAICTPDTMYDPIVGTFYWPEAALGGKVILQCTQQKSGEDIMTASRACLPMTSGEAKWGTANISQCQPASKLSIDLQNLTNTQITDGNRQSMTRRFTLKRAFEVKVAKEKTFKLRYDCEPGPRQKTLRNLKPAIIVIFACVFAALACLICNNIKDVSHNINKLSKEVKGFTEHHLSQTTDIIENILETESSAVSREVITNTFQTLNNIMVADAASLEAAETRHNSSSRLVQAVDTLLNGINITTEDFEYADDSLAGFAVKIEPKSFEGISLFMDVKQGDSLSTDKVIINKSDSPLQSSYSGIRISKHVLASLSEDKRRAVSKGIFSVYRESKIYSTILSASEGKAARREVVLDNNDVVNVTREINSVVIGASFPGVAINETKGLVLLTFQHYREGLNPECVYWKQSDNARGLWSTEGCNVSKLEPKLTVCECDHLTNFALLMTSRPMLSQSSAKEKYLMNDVYDIGDQLTDRDKKILSLISYVGCGISLIAICFTIFVLLVFRKLHKDVRFKKILINICAGIGLSDLLFLVGMNDYIINNAVACKSIAALLHFSLLAALCWMAVQAFYMYTILVKVFDTKIKHFPLKTCLFGWGIPVVIISVTVGINKTENYDLQAGKICWLSRLAFYAAFLGPVSLIMLFNTTVFILILKQIVRRSFNRLKKSAISSTIVRIKGAVGVIILFGLAWLFALFAIGDFGLIFQYLFAVFNSLQGLFIFLYFCARKVVVIWKRNSVGKHSFYENDSKTKSLQTGCVSESKISSSEYVLEQSAGLDQSEGFHLTERTVQDEETRKEDEEESTVFKGMEDDEIYEEGKTVPERKRSVFRGRWQFKYGTVRRK